MTKKKKRVRVHKVTPHIEPDVHEVVLHVESPEPPPQDVHEETHEDVGFQEPIATTRKKRGIWAWLLGSE
jgi:hypothetical protein